MHFDALLATGIGLGAAGLTLVGQASPDTFGWVAQLGPAAGAAVVAYVAFMYVRKRDEDAKTSMDRQEAQAKEDRSAVAKLFDRVEKMGEENRAGLDKVVDRMEKMIRENAQVHSNGLAQISTAIQLVVSTVTAFQKSQDEIVTKVSTMEGDLAVLSRLAGIRNDEPGDAAGRADSKQIRKPRRLPEHKEGE